MLEADRLSVRVVCVVSCGYCCGVVIASLGVSKFLVGRAFSGVDVLRCYLADLSSGVVAELFLYLSY